MVGGLLLAGAALTYNKFSINKYKFQRTGDIKVEINQLHISLKTYLDKKGVCLSSFEGKKVSNDILIKEIKLPNGKVRFKTDTRYGMNLVKINKMGMINFKESDEKAPGFIQGDADFEITYEKLGGHFGAKFTKKVIPLMVVINKIDKKILACGRSKDFFNIPKKISPPTKTVLKKTLNEALTPNTEMNKKLEAVLNNPEQMKKIETKIEKELKKSGIKVNLKSEDAKKLLKNLTDPKSPLNKEVKRLLADPEALKKLQEQLKQLQNK